MLPSLFFYPICVLCFLRPVAVNNGHKCGTMIVAGKLLTLRITRRSAYTAQTWALPARAWPRRLPRYNRWAEAALPASVLS